MAARLWKILCSLKLAIVLATAAVVTVLLGSLLMPGRPEVFGAMDRMPLGDWYAQVGSQFPGQSWWVLGAGLLTVLLGVNTACCFLDWLLRLRTRWRKTGEYLLHLGFVLALAGYLWGSVAGFRNEGVRLMAGDTIPLPAWPGHYLRLEAVEPLPAPDGRTKEIAAEMALLRGDEEVARHRVRTNSPLLHDGLAVVPLAAVPTTAGLRVFASGIGYLDLVPGARIPLPNGAMLQVLRFFPWASRLSDGALVFHGEEPVRPAVELELSLPGSPPWRGWYLPDEGVPASLAKAGLAFQPMETVSTFSGIFAVNRDPGAPLAFAGGIAMSAGVLLALFSFYAKRARGDRPSI